jgi:predicted  nucleic acid-binding Zn-ribbon protein
MSELHLLDIQHLDTEAEQLRHRHVNFPERAARDGAIAERVRLAGEIDAIGVARLEVSSRQKRFEDEAQIFSSKADEDDKRLYSGDVGMKGLQPLQDEIKGLRERQGGLEDQALEAMEESEGLATRLEETQVAHAATEEQITVLEAEIASIEDEIATQLGEVATQRAAAAAAVDPADLAEYERLRPGMGSATVVRFDGGNCVGCPSTMPAMELDRMKHAEAGSVLSCNECGRIVLN